MSVPVIYQPLPAESRLVQVLMHDKRVSYLFTASYSFGRGPLQFYQDRRSAEQISLEKGKLSALFCSNQDIIASMDLLIELVGDVLMMSPGIVHRRLTIDFSVEIEEELDEFINNHSLAVPKSFPASLLFGDSPLTSDEIVGNSGGPLRVVSIESVSRATQVFALLEQKSFVIDDSSIMDEYNTLTLLYISSAQHSEIIVAGY